MGAFFKGLQNYIENKNKGNEHKIILGDFNCTMYKMGMYSGNKTRSIYRCPSNHALLKLIVYYRSRIYGEGRTLDKTYDKSFVTRSRIEKFYTDKKNC